MADVNVLEPPGKCPSCLMSLAEYADNGIVWVDDTAYHNGCEPSPDKNGSAQE